MVFEATGQLTLYSSIILFLFLACYAWGGEKVVSLLLKAGLAKLIILILK
jgi:hypothetical protein